MKPRDGIFLALSAILGFAGGCMVGQDGAPPANPDPFRQGFVCGEEKIKHKLPPQWTVSSEDSRVWDRDRRLVCDSGGKPVK